MSYIFLVVAFALSVLDWLSITKDWKRLGYLTKPGVMVALLSFMVENNALTGHLLWFAAGLLFSLAGDVFLMLPREQFIPGLVSFLLAHVAYLVGFNATLPPANAASLILALLVAVVAGQLIQRISAGLVASGKTSLRGPVVIYSIVISLMLLSALLTLVRGDEWRPAPAFIASAGALLFFLSDTLLAWNRFVAPLPSGRLRVRITYHLGQMLIIWGALLNFLRFR